MNCFLVLPMLTAFFALASSDCEKYGTIVNGIVQASLNVTGFSETPQFIGTFYARVAGTYSFRIRSSGISENEFRCDLQVDGTWYGGLNGNLNLWTKKTEFRGNSLHPYTLTCTYGASNVDVQVEVDTPEPSGYHIVSGDETRTCHNPSARDQCYGSGPFHDDCSVITATPSLSPIPTASGTLSPTISISPSQTDLISASPIRSPSQGPNPSELADTLASGRSLQPDQVTPSQLAISTWGFKPVAVTETWQILNTRTGTDSRNLSLWIPVAIGVATLFAIVVVVGRFVIHRLSQIADPEAELPDENRYNKEIEEERKPEESIRAVQSVDSFCSNFFSNRDAPNEGGFL